MKAAQKTKRSLLELVTTTVQPFYLDDVKIGDDASGDDQVNQDILLVGDERFDPSDAIDTFAGFSVDELDIKDSVIFLKKDPAKRIPVRDVVKQEMCAQFTTHEPIFERAWFSMSQLQSPTEDRPRMCRQAHFMEVEVDTETGEVEVTRIVNVNDVGKAVHHEGVEGQQYGGMYMALGRNRSEEVVWDEATGVMLNGNLIDYKIATLRDCGPIEPIIVETALGYGPYGSTGIGEDVADHASSLLGPAIYNAIGEWINDYPITPDKVLEALGKVRGS